MAGPNTIPRPPPVQPARSARETPSDAVLLTAWNETFSVTLNKATRKPVTLNKATRCEGSRVTGQHERDSSLTPSSECVSEKWLRGVISACGHTLRQMKN